MNHIQRIAEASQVFTPGYPVQQKDLFSGRSDQLDRCVEAIVAPGRHPVVFGQRGVGKTSLANILSQSLQGVTSVKVSCDGTDDFVTVWNRVFMTASITFKQKAFGFSTEETVTSIPLANALGHDPANVTPAEVAGVLKRITGYCVVILDEFDKITQQLTKAAFADLVKILSDNTANVTLIFVGVADDIHHLIGEHPSIDRNLVQIELPLMKDDEVTEIFSTGMKRLGFTTSMEVDDIVPGLAGGFPHYAHLLGLCSAKACITNAQTHLSSALFDVACNLAVDDAIEKYRDAFAQATATTQASRYPFILASCGHASSDPRGVFRATDVVDALWKVFNERVSVQAVVPALGQFLSNARAHVLRAVKVGGRQCYQFSDPMMRPFCRLKAREMLRTR
jgi:hypothetical protein